MRDMVLNKTHLFQTILCPIYGGANSRAGKTTKRNMRWIKHIYFKTILVGPAHQWSLLPYSMPYHNEAFTYIYVPDLDCPFLFHSASQPVQDTRHCVGIIIIMKHLRIYICCIVHFYFSQHHSKMRDIVLGSRKDFFQPSSLTFHSNRWIANWQTSLEYWSSFSQTVILTKTYHSNRYRYLLHYQLVDDNLEQWALLISFIQTVALTNIKD